jgi:hypothetical protein
MFYTMNRLSVILVSMALAGCATPSEKWSSIPRGPDLTTTQVKKKLGNPSSIRHEYIKVFRYGPGGWFNGNATVYRYNFGNYQGKERYVEIFFDGDKYLADSTNIPLEF